MATGGFSRWFRQILESRLVVRGRAWSHYFREYAPPPMLNGLPTPKPTCACALGGGSSNGVAVDFSGCDAHLDGHGAFCYVQDAECAGDIHMSLRHPGAYWMTCEEMPSVEDSEILYVTSSEARLSMFEGAQLGAECPIGYRYPLRDECGGGWTPRAPRASS